MTIYRFWMCYIVIRRKSCLFIGLKADENSFVSAKVSFGKLFSGGNSSECICKGSFSNLRINMQLQKTKMKEKRSGIKIENGVTH